MYTYVHKKSLGFFGSVLETEFVPGTLSERSRSADPTRNLESRSSASRFFSLSSVLTGARSTRATVATRARSSERVFLKTSLTTRKLRTSTDSTQWSSTHVRGVPGIPIAITSRCSSVWETRHSLKAARRRTEQTLAPRKRKALEDATKPWIMSLVLSFSNRIARNDVTRCRSPRAQGCCQSQWRHARCDGDARSVLCFRLRHSCSSDVTLRAVLMALFASRCQLLGLSRSVALERLTVEPDRVSKSSSEDATQDDRV